MDHLFIVTYGRSGSTFLLNALNAIDGYCIRGENGGVAQGMAQALDSFQEIKTRYSYKDEGGPQSPWYGIKQSDGDQWGRAMAEAFTRHILKPEPGTRVTGYKEIRHTPTYQTDKVFFATLDFLANRFSNARIVFNTRSIEEVAHSGWWTRRDFGTVRSEVETCDARFQKGKEILGDRAFQIDYEQYNGNPEGFRPLLDWLGETVPPERLAEICATRLDHGREREIARKSGLKSRLRQVLGL